jgi:hypothetical protein
MTATVTDAATHASLLFYAQTADRKRTIKYTSLDSRRMPSRRTGKTEHRYLSQRHLLPLALDIRMAHSVKEAALKK